MKKLVSLFLLSSMLLSMTACGGAAEPEAPAAEEKPAASEPTTKEEAKPEEPKEVKPEDVDGELIFDQAMELEFADQFSIDLYQGGYKIIKTVKQADSEFLIVPEGKTVPADLAENVVVLQQPVDNICLGAISFPYFMDAVDSMDAVSSVAHDKDYWYLDSLVAGFESGDIIYTGNYKTPDFETMTANGTQLVFDSYSQDEEVLDKYAELGIPVLIDGSYLEASPMAKNEWIKLVGAVMNRDTEADAFFDEQVAIIDELATAGETGKTASMFYLSGTSDKVYARKGGDYMATMIGLAGGDYIMKDVMPDETGIATLTFEEFYANCKDADYMFYAAYDLEFVDQLVERYPLFADFKAVQEGNVFSTPAQYMQAVTKLPLAIEEMHKVMLDPNCELQYLVKMK